jgi:hypothetical protein
MKFIAAQALFSVLTDISAYSCVKYFKISNEFIYNIYMLGEFILLSSALYFSIVQSFIRKILIKSLFILPAVTLLSYLFVSFYNLNYLILALSFIFLSVFNLLYLIVPDIRREDKPDPMFWVVIGHVIYFLGVTPYFAGREIMLSRSPDLADELFSYINNVLAICRYAFIALGIILTYYKQPFNLVRND